MKITILPFIENNEEEEDVVGVFIGDNLIILK
jgi:hypothetical protein